MSDIRKILRGLKKNRQQSSFVPPKTPINQQPVKPQPDPSQQPVAPPLHLKNLEQFKIFLTIETLGRHANSTLTDYSNHPEKVLDLPQKAYFLRGDQLIQKTKVQEESIIVSKGMDLVTLTDLLWNQDIDARIIKKGAYFYFFSDSKTPQIAQAALQRLAQTKNAAPPSMRTTKVLLEKKFPRELNEIIVNEYLKKSQEEIITIASVASNKYFDNTVDDVYIKRGRKKEEPPIITSYDSGSECIIKIPYNEERYSCTTFYSWQEFNKKVAAIKAEIISQIADDPRMADDPDKATRNGKPIDIQFNGYGIK